MCAICHVQPAAFSLSPWLEMAQPQDGVTVLSLEFSSSGLGSPGEPSAHRNVSSPLRPGIVLSGLLPIPASGGQGLVGTGQASGWWVSVHGLAHSSGDSLASNELKFKAGVRVSNF